MTRTPGLKSNPTVHELLKFHAEQAPTAIAIASPGQRPLTYERLQTHVESVVSALRNMGIDRNDRVAIVLDNGPDLAVAFLAVASAAGAAPLNPAYRAEDFEFYLSDLGAKALIVAAGVDSPARAVATKHRIPVIELTSSESYAGMFAIEGVGDTAQIEATFAEPNDEALLLHTSGTTSRPKLVPLTQRNICTSAGNVAVALQLSQQDCCLNVMPLFHIHGLIGAILSSVTAGGSIVCTPGFDSEQFFTWLDEFQPTWYTAVPTMHQAVLGQADEHREVIQRTALRLIRSSSSSLPPSVMEKLERVFRAPVIESYGMTEAAHQMCSNPLPPKQRKPGAVGLPAGPDVAIMDEDGNLLGPESTGEIVIRGTNVTSGYANNPAANESAFSSGWFRTGDLGRTDNEGYLYISGRLKEIINRGGEKVSPREIDEALLDHPAIRQAVSFAVPHDGLGEDIAAAVVLSDGSEENEQAIRTFLFSRLADFKVPSRVVFVDEIPKGPTGKLQRIGLYEQLAPYFEAEFVAPEGPVEQSLAKFYGELLRHGDIGIHDNFFFLGGDSLSATRLVSRVRGAFQIELPLKSVFREPTISGLAPMIEDLVIRQIEEAG